MNSLFEKHGKKSTSVLKDMMINTVKKCNATKTINDRFDIDYTDSPNIQIYDNVTKKQTFVPLFALKDVIRALHNLLE